MAKPAASIGLFLGAPIEHASERAALERAHALALAAGIDAVILANFTVRGRQIDALIATDDGALLIEAKGCSQPVAGGFNGPWRLKTAAGEHDVRNGYLQALGAKNALRDAMASLAPSPPYPDAAVVLVPRVPFGSSLPTGDAKVQIVGLANLRLPGLSNTPSWSLDRWREFARHHGLVQTTSLPALLDPLLLAADRGLDDYARAFLETYAPRQAGLLAFPCHISDQEASSDDLPDQLQSATGLLVLGPSGCGKSLAALAVAIRRLEAGDVPLFIEAKLFEGSLREVLDREASLLGFRSGQALLSACRRTGRVPVLVVDGYNECGAGHRLGLTRALTALIRRSGAKLLVSSQVALEGELLDLPVVNVPRPPLALKASIARFAAAGGLPAISETLLDAVGSGLEARMLGEVGSDLVEGASRFALFDLYVRRRLGQLGAYGIRTLSSVAGLLADRLSFSLSIRDFDRLQADAQQDAALSDALIGAGLLARRGDRLSFGHELFLQAFQAEAVVRRAGGDAGRLAEALGHPVMAEGKSFVVGAIDDPVLLAGVLGQVTDSRLLAKCLAGECGGQAKTWAEGRCREVFAAGLVEAEGAVFELDEAHFMRVGPTQGRLRAWSAQETAFTRILPQWLGTPERLPKLLAAARATDRRLADEFTRLLPEAREKRVGLRSGLFGSVYIHGDLGLSATFDASSDLRRWRGTAEELATAFESATGDISPGEAHVLFQLARGVSGMPRLTAPLIPKLIARLWRGTPYHLRLDLLEAAGFCWAADEIDRLAVIEALEGIGQIDDIMLSSQWIESMQQLGALEADADEHLIGLREQTAAILAAPDDPEMQSAAASAKSIAREV